MAPLKRRVRILLTKLYKDTKEPTAFASVKKLLTAVRRKYPKTKLSDVRSFLSGERSYVLHKPIRRNFVRSKIFASRKNNLWESDLTEMQTLSKRNDKTRYLLTIIDVFSKYAYVIPLKSKRGSEVTKAFARVLKKESPSNLRTDQGKEYVNHDFKRLMKRYKINHYTTHEGDIKTGVAERFNRTIKSRIYKLLTDRKSSRYIDKLSDLVDGYNNSKHRSIGMAPREVNQKNTKIVWRRLYGSGAVKTKKTRPKFRVGEHVLITVSKNLYTRGYTPNYSREIFTINRIIKHWPFRYKLMDSTGETLIGSFYEPELQAIDVDRVSL